jgi:hypothetical protein
MVLGTGVAGQIAGRQSSEPGSPRHAAALTVENPYALPNPGATWFKGNLHASSVQGIGKDLPRAVGEFYRSRGYAFLGISDQNTYTWIDGYQRRGVTAVPIIQASYPFGNLLALGIDHWLPSNTPQEAVDWIRRDGGFPILTAAADKPPASEASQGLRGLYGIEVYNARSQADLTELWDALLSRGEHVFAFAGDDLRSVSDQAAGKAWIEVLAFQPDLDSIFEALKQGAFIASTGAHFKRLELEGRIISVEADGNASLRFIGKGGRLLAVTDTGLGSYTLTGAEGYVRVEVLADDGSRAWSQPFFLSRR